MSLINLHIDQPGQLFAPYWKKCIAAGRSSAFDTWLAFGAPANPTVQELEWLQNRSTPEMKVRQVENTGSLERQVTLQPHGVTLIEILKLY